MNKNMKDLPQNQRYIIYLSVGIRERLY